MSSVERRPKGMEKKVARLLIREAQGKQIALHQLQLP